jgi:hypothetical protein
MYFCNHGNQPNVISIYALSNNSQPSKSNVLAYNVAVAPSETFYFGQEKFILDEGERLVARAGMGTITSTLTFMSIGSSEYSSNAKGVATLDGDGVGAVVVTSPGAGYTSPPTVTFTGCNGQDATATATLTDGGQIHEVIITNAGSGYICPPGVTLSGGNNPVIEGCTDANATNYDHLATIDNGGCQYPPASQIVKESNIKCWWKFDETSGTTATDSVNGIVATLENPAGDDSEWVAGKPNMGNSVEFNGNSTASPTYFSVPANSLWNLGGSPFSISLWFKGTSDMFTASDGTTYSRALLATQTFYGTTTDGDWMFSLAHPGGSGNEKNTFNLGFYESRTAYGTWQIRGGWGDLDDENWHHVAITSEGATNSEVAVYIDGFIGTSSAIGSSVPVTPFTTHSVYEDGGDNGIYIGHDVNWGNGAIKGLVDDIRFYDIKLDSSDIDAIVAGDYS